MAKPSVFISYARADDEPFVKRLHGALTEAGYDVWWDRESMQARGMTFLQEIRDAITGVDRVILVVGPEIHKSAYVRAEWEYALSICKVVNPILRLGDYALVPDALKNVHTVDCRKQKGFDAAFEEIRRVVDEPSGELGALRAVPLLSPWYIRREEDLRDVIKLVCADTTGPVVVTSKKQTVTLQGTGGIGKTTLAAALAHDCDVRRTFPDGIFWIEIGKPEPGKEPPITLRQGDIGVAFRDTRDEYPDVARGKSRLAEILADKRVLLVLDDVWTREHAEAFRVSAPRCRLLITTRQAGLITQLGAVNHGLDILTDDEGVTLIETRLEIVGEENPHRDDQRKIVHLLGGHTLAISIAAAQLAERGADFAPKLLERLQKRQGGDNPFKDLMMEESDRQFNLEATLSLSYEALSEDYKRRFRALGVFAAEGSFDVAAVATVWGDGADDIDDAEDALHVLWRGSLITRETEGRYSQHSLLRTYALALLQRTGEVEEYRERHFAHYEALHGDYDTNNTPERFPFIRQDLGNVQHTISWGFQTKAERAVDMVCALDAFLMHSDLHGLRRELLVRANTIATGIKYELGQARTMRALGELFLRLDEPHHAREYYDHALLIFERIGNEHGQANTLVGLADLFTQVGDLVLAQRNYNRALPIFERINDRLGQGRTLAGLSKLLMRDGKIGQAREYHDRALSFFHQIGDKRGQANILHSLGDLVMRLDELESAREYYNRALLLCEQIDSRLGQANILRALGDLVMRLNELESARKYYNRALLLYEQIDSRLGQANTLVALGDLYIHRNEPDKAKAFIERVLPMYVQIGNEAGHARALVMQGNLYVLRDEPDQAIVCFNRALFIFDQLGDGLGQANTLRELGNLLVHHNEIDQARVVYRKALELYKAVQESLGQTYLLGSMASLETAQGNLEMACEYYQQLFIIVDATNAYANHPIIQGWRKQYQELCGESDS